MKITGIFISFIVAAALYTTLLPLTGCQKELNFDRVDSTRQDSIPADPTAVIFPLCNLCNATNPLKQGEWSFKTNTSYLCGNITDAIITGDGNAYTFFGPSACSIDSGLVITVYIEPGKLIGDTTNVNSSGAAFFYYDHNSPDYILVSQRGTNFTVKIDQYVKATGAATGSFSGGTFRPNGQFIYISEGRFNIKLRR